MSSSKKQKREELVSRHVDRDFSSDEESEEEEEFEDPFGDDIVEADSEDETVARGSSKFGAMNIDDDEDADGEVDMEGDDEDEDEEDVPIKLYRPGMEGVTEEEAQELEYSSRAYDMMHKMNVQWPCLSFDFVRDELGQQRSRFPHTMYSVAGTQADSRANNKLFIMKMSQLHKTKYDSDDSEDEQSDSDDEDAVDDDPILEHQELPHYGGVNRIRCMPQKGDFVATWAETGAVHVWNIGWFLKALDAPPTAMNPKKKPIFTFNGHKTEGFALDWCPTKLGSLVTGDCAGEIYLWDAPNGQQWKVGSTPYVGHTDSVEDLQWHPADENIFGSCSVDKTIRIWDRRRKPTLGAALCATVHETDVNVISWNRNHKALIASGADDGSFRIWDLRMFSNKASGSRPEPSAQFSYHKKAITSIEWDPEDSSSLALSCEDNTVTVWDLSVERDTEANPHQVEDPLDLPPQLLFIHQGQRNVKEIHYHSQIPGVIMSTAEDGFNVFKPSLSLPTEKAAEEEYVSEDDDNGNAETAVYNAEDDIKAASEAAAASLSGRKATKPAATADMSDDDDATTEAATTTSTNEEKKKKKKKNKKAAAEAEAATTSSAVAEEKPKKKTKQSKKKKQKQ